MNNNILLIVIAVLAISWNSAMLANAKPNAKSWAILAGIVTVLANCYLLYIAIERLVK